MDIKGVWRVHVEDAEGACTLTVHAYSEAEAERAARKRALLSYGYRNPVRTEAQRMRNDR